MIIKKPIYIILALAVLFTIIVQLDLTHALLFTDYWQTKKISGVNYYLSLINESSKGNWRLGSPYILEWRYKEYLYPALNINAAGLFKRVLGLDIKTYAAVMGYLAIFVLMASLLTAFSQIFRFSYFGYLVAAAYIFFPRGSLWYRTLSPEINFIPLALFLVFYFANFKFWKRELGLGILAGILFYVYPYYWTFVLALLAVSDLWKFWNQKKIFWEYLYKYPIIAGFASWYAIHLWRLYQLPYYQESAARIGALHSRFPAGLYTQSLLLASLALFFFLKKYVFSKVSLSMIADGALDKIAAGLVASLIVLNQQLITGMQLEFNSHYLPTILVFVIAFYGSLVFIFAQNFSAYRKILVFASFLAAIGFASGRIYLAASNFGGSSYIGGQADEVVDWFLENGVRDKVVYAPKDLGDEINLWTNNYLVFHDSQGVQITPTEELIDRFTYYDITNRYFTENLLDEQVQFFGQTFLSSWQKNNVINKIKAKLLGREFVPAAKTEYIKYDLKPMYEKRTYPDPVEFNKYLKKYQVDYLVYGQKDRNSIYKDARGKIVFDGRKYVIKKRE